MSTTQLVLYWSGVASSFQMSHFRGNHGHEPPSYRGTHTYIGTYIHPFLDIICTIWESWKKFSGNYSSKVQRCQQRVCDGIQNDIDVDQTRGDVVPIVGVPMHQMQRRLGCVYFQQWTLDSASLLPPSRISAFLQQVRSSLTLFRISVKDGYSEVTWNSSLT